MGFTAAYKAYKRGKYAFNIASIGLLYIDLVLLGVFFNPEIPGSGNAQSQAFGIENAILQSLRKLGVGCDVTHAAVSRRR